ncbi:MAG: hypothetical protein CBB71_19505 [Rhodopirellula sp. TMED11]|nr:MAG: hypothetical protein CBB71_19505 [Rhodopirellula sp. TMED11]
MLSQSSSRALRLTILEHVLQRPQSLARSPGSVACGTVHWDWCFEMPAQVVTHSADHRLWTWASDPVSDLPALAGGTSSLIVPCCRLPNHRTRYLDYEGEISGQRGSVRALARRRFTIAEAVGLEPDEAQSQRFMLRVLLIDSADDGPANALLSGLTELIVRDASGPEFACEKEGHRTGEILLR